MTRSIRPLVYPYRIIGALLLFLLASCSAIKLGYDSAPTFTYWWLDSLVDFNSTQSPAVRNSLTELHAWHRMNALPAYADTLHKMQQLAPYDVTPAQLCGLWTEVQAHMEQLGVAAAKGISAFTPTLQREQLHHLALQFEKRNRKWRAEWLDVTPDRLREHRLKQAVDRAEMLYDRLEETQLAILRSSIEGSSFDARLNYREIQRRQQDILQTLNEHSALDPARTTHVQAEVLALLERLRRSPDPVYRAHQEKMTLEGCTTLAALHNSTSPAQRANALQKLQDYEADVRALVDAKN
jgi:Family of unknown function (DUF6279)